MSSTPFRMYKGFEHQGGHAVPLIMHWPAGIRQGKWKLVRALNHPWELYDMDADRTELNNLVEKHPEKVQALEKAWET